MEVEQASIGLRMPPFPTSLNDRSHAEEIVRYCENREFRLFLPHDASADDRKTEILGQVLVMEMSALLYLGQIHEAWHLWRRTHNSTRPNLSKIWTVGAAMLAQDSSLAISNLEKLKSDGPRPLTEEIIRDIVLTYRERVSEALAKVYEKLHVDRAAEKLGFESAELVVSYLENRGWTRSGEGGVFLAPPKKEKEVCSVALKQGLERITDIVSFLERERLNA